MECDGRLEAFQHGTFIDLIKLAYRIDCEVKSRQAERFMASLMNMATHKAGEKKLG